MFTLYTAVVPKFIMLRTPKQTHLIRCRTRTHDNTSLHHSRFLFLHLSQSWMNPASAYKRGSWRHKKLHVEITCCILSSCTLNPSAGVAGGEATCLLFSAPLPKSPFQDPKSSIIAFLLLQHSRTPSPFFGFVCKHLSKPHFCVTTLLNLLHLWPLGLCSESVAVKQAASASRTFQSCFVLNQWTELQIDLVESALGIKLLLWSGRSCAYLPWSGQWIFRTWSHLKDTTWHLHLSPGVQSTQPLKQWSFTINHSQCLETLKAE